MKHYKISSIIILLLYISNAGCKKYLDEKSDKKLVIINSLQDMQALFDDYSNVTFSDPGAGEVSADDYYLTTADWSSRTETDRRLYTWEKDFLFPAQFNAWYYCYLHVYYANTVLENIDKVSVNASNQAQWNNVKGQALFLRGKAFFLASLIWAPAYDEQTAATDPGLPLRLNSNFEEKSVRSSVAATYDQLLADLKASISLLPLEQVQVIRPTKAAAYGLLARTYLAMRKYDSCAKYANLCLQLKADLMDYNNPNSPDLVNLNSTNTPFIQFNREVIFESVISTPSPLSGSRAKIDSFLYLSYAADDLRKTAFFRSNNNGTYAFKGNYSTGLFGGLSTNEVYLMRAECAARSGNVPAAMNDLNTLLIKRWKTNTFVPFAAADAADALSKILIERRKELLMRGLRWMDLKRLNKEGANITLKRVVNGQTYVLPPNDPRYALPIPEDVIALSGMTQNPR